MKDVKMNITSYQAQGIIESLHEFGYETEKIYGCLLDSYFCELGENNLKLGRKKVRKFLIIREVYINHWQSGLELISTDNEKTYQKYYKIYTEDVA